MPAKVNIGVVGTGLVGSCFLKQLAPIASKYGIAVVLVARSSKALISKSYEALNLDDLAKSNANFEANAGALSPSEIASFLAKSPVPSVLVDNTSNEELAQNYPLFTSQGVSIVTPNKKAFSSDLKLWKELQQPKEPALVYHESTVGAGLPIISTVKDLVATGDNIKQVDGILSGTLSYIFNEFSQDGAPAFSEIVKDAKAKGYTEPDPREDLNGLDVARKVTILSRLAGVEVESPTSFEVESLIPKPLESAQSAEDFLAGLPKFDSEIADRKNKAAAEGKVLRFVGKIDVANQKCKVGIEEYPLSHPFASLKGSDNVVSFLTERYPSPLIIQGAGAGDAVTAMGVLSDLIKVAQRL